MTTEEFIRDCAKRGWSKTQTREALGLSTNTFWDMLALLPDIVWPRRGQSHGNKVANANREPASEKLLASLERARAAHRANHLYTWQGRTGTVPELAKFSPAGERTIFRRLKEGKSVEEAFGTPPNKTPPNMGLRALKGANYSYTTREGQQHEEETGSQP